MRPAGRSETDSLYFTYPHFSAPSPVERDSPSFTACVAVVGAGPIGLTAALALAKQGIRSVVFDAKSSFNDGSRAICIARPSYYILEQIGAIAPFLEKALPWTTGRTFYRGQQVLEFHMPDGPDEKFRPMYNLQQQYIEKFLWQAAESNELIEIRWQSEVTGIEDSPAGACLAITDPAGLYSLEAKWVLACDGARSAIRTMRGHRLKGENFEGSYVIADIQMDHDYPTIRRALFDPASRPGGTVLIHKEPDNIWRIDYQLDDGESVEKALREETVRESVAAVLNDIGYDGAWELEWWSVYSANTLALDDYRDGCIFFVGDSAHVVPIFGVRGLNNGFADAANIGWKLGWVINGKAGAELLDSYTPERRAATLDVFANATKSARFMTPQTHGWKLMRDAALSLALTQPFAGQLANPRQMTAFTYSGSPAVLPDESEAYGQQAGCQQSGIQRSKSPPSNEQNPNGRPFTDSVLEGSAFCQGPSIGALMPDAKLNEGFLSDKLGKGFTVLCFNKELAQQILLASAKDELLTVVLLPQPSLVSVKFAATSSSAYLVRPDMHIAGRWLEAKPSDVINGYRTVTFQQGAK